MPDPRVRDLYKRLVWALRSHPNADPDVHARLAHGLRQAFRKPVPSDSTLEAALDKGEHRHRRDTCASWAVAIDLRGQIHDWGGWVRGCPPGQLGGGARTNSLWDRGLFHGALMQCSLPHRHCSAVVPGLSTCYVMGCRHTHAAALHDIVQPSGTNKFLSQQKVKGTPLCERLMQKVATLLMLHWPRYHHEHV